MGIKVLKSKKYYKEVILQQYRGIRAPLTIKSRIGLNRGIKAPLTIKSKIGLSKSVAQAVIEEAGVTVFK